MKFEIINKAAGLCQRAGANIKLHSPQILVVTGIIGVIGSTILACRATLKVNEVLKEAENEIESVKTVLDDEKMKEKYSEDDGQNDLKIIYTKAGFKIARLYLPAAGLMALSIFSIVMSNNILCKRNAALAAAYAVIDRSFKDYRKRVVDRYGEEVDKELEYNMIEGTFADTYTDDNGDEVTVTTPAKIAQELSGFARYFDQYTSKAWEPDEAFNEMFLRGQQNYANNLLRVNGFIYLNDVCEALGIQKSVAGNEVGWIYDKERTDADKSDNFVDFEMTKAYRKLDSGEVIPTILLNFNCDGSITQRAYSRKLITE